MAPRYLAEVVKARLPLLRAMTKASPDLLMMSRALVARPWTGPELLAKVASRLAGAPGSVRASDVSDLLLAKEVAPLTKLRIASALAFEWIAPDFVPDLVPEATATGAISWTWREQPVRDAVADYVAQLSLRFSQDWGDRNSRALAPFASFCENQWWVSTMHLGPAAAERYAAHLQRFSPEDGGKLRIDLVNGFLSWLHHTSPLRPVITTFIAARPVTEHYSSRMQNILDGFADWWSAGRPPKPLSLDLADAYRTLLQERSWPPDGPAGKISKTAQSYADRTEEFIVFALTPPEFAARVPGFLDKLGLSPAHAARYRTAVREYLLPFLGGEGIWTPAQIDPGTYQRFIAHASHRRRFMALSELSRQKIANQTWAFLTAVAPGVRFAPAQLPAHGGPSARDGPSSTLG